MKNLLLLPAFILLLASCTPRTYIGLRPLDDTAKTEDSGLQSVSRTENGIRVVTGFERPYVRQLRRGFEEYLIMDTEVTNLTDKPIEVRPSDFTVSCITPEGDVQPVSRFGEKTIWLIHALDPDQQALQARKEMQREDKRMRFERIATSVMTVGAIVSTAAMLATTNNDIFSQNGGIGNSYRTNFILTQLSVDATWNAIGVKRFLDHQRFVTQMQRLDFELGNFERETFRSRTLLPGESMRGKLLFRANRAAKTVRMAYANTQHTFDFEQALFDVYTNERREK